MFEKINIAFFGSSEFSIHILEELKNANLLPSLIITTPDAPKGRKLLLAPPITKLWAEKNGISVIQPVKLDFEFANKLKAESYTLFVVASYGKIIPKNILDIPSHKTLNVHPSLLPKLRGPSPIQTAILEDLKETGVSIMELDEKMDHGPILAQEKTPIQEWPPRADILERELAQIGGKLLSDIIPDWVAGKIKAKEQDHGMATFSRIITKEDGLIDVGNDPYQNYLKFQALYGWPGTYFFTEKNSKKIRVVIKDVSFKNGEFKIERVIPEGKKEMDYVYFIRSI